MVHPDTTKLRVLRQMVIKEIWQLLRDKQMLRVLMVGPLVQLITLGFAANNDVVDVPLLLLDQDRTTASRELRDDFLASGRFELVGEVQSQREIEPWLTRGRAQVALVIESGYARKLERNEAPKVQLLVDGADANSAGVAVGYASSIVSAAGARMHPQDLSRFGQFQLRPRVWYNPDLKSRWFYLPAILALVLMLNTLILPSMGIVREKEIGTLEQILVTPLRPWQMIVGKLLPFVVIGFVNIVAITAIIVFGFRVPLNGSFALLLLLSAPFLLTNLSLGLWVSTLVRTQQQAMMTAIFLVMIPMIYLSGLIFPIENMPRVIQAITFAIPLRYYAVILRGVFLKASDFSVLWPQALILLAFGLGVLTLASSRFRKTLD